MRVITNEVELSGVAGGDGEGFGSGWATVSVNPNGNGSGGEGAGSGNEPWVAIGGGSAPAYVIPLLPAAIAVGGLAGGINYLLTTDKPTMNGAVVATVSGSLGAAIAFFPGLGPMVAGATVAGFGGWQATKQP